jgi:hypothetical protein
VRILSEYWALGLHAVRNRIVAHSVPYDFDA